MRGSGERISDLEAGVVEGSAENVIEVEFGAPLLLVVDSRGSATCEFGDKIGVGGACAMCAMPLVPRSMDIRVVGFVLAVTLLKVRGSDKKDEDEREGAGEGGDVGGRGRIEASSSASGFEGDQVEECDERGGVDRPICEVSSSLSTIWAPSGWRDGISSCCSVEARGRSPRMQTGSFVTRTGSLTARTEPPNFFCSQPMIGLLLWRFTRFWVVIVGRKVRSRDGSVMPLVPHGDYING